MGVQEREEVQRLREGLADLQKQVLPAGSGCFESRVWGTVEGLGYLTYKKMHPPRTLP